MAKNNNGINNNPTTQTEEPEYPDFGFGDGAIGRKPQNKITEEARNGAIDSVRQK